jgi:hypothetical protein
LASLTTTSRGRRPSQFAEHMRRVFRVRAIITFVLDLLGSGIRFA